MIRKTTLTIFLLTCAFLVQAAAQTAATDEKQSAIKELVVLINGDNKAEQMANIMTDQMQSAREATVQSVLDEQTDLSAAERKAIEDSLLSDRKNSIKRYQDKLMQKLDYNAMINEVAYTVYDKYYSLEEIRDLTTFYKTPTGQKSLKMMTAITTDSMRLVQERLIPKIPIVIREIQEEDRLEIEQKINARKPKPKNGAGK